MVPKINVTEYLTDGYTLVFMKKPNKKFCLGCVKNFSVSKGFRMTEDERYLTIHSP
jgi:hypothetical protein